MLKDKPEYADMIGDHVDAMRRFFVLAKMDRQYLEFVSTISTRMHKHQEAVEQVREPDVPQAEDEVSKYLRELGIHVRIDEKGAVPGDVLRSFQAAKIDQNVGLMRNLIAKVQIKNVSEDVEVEDAEHYVQVLEDHLVAGPENEMRRNWFNSVIPVGMRVEDTRRVEAQLSPWEAVTVPPQPTARVGRSS